MSPSSSSNRRHGGQPGNQNARKHGLSTSRRLLARPEPGCHRLSRLARTHRYINPALDPRDELTRDIQQALKEVYVKLEAGELGATWLA